MLAAALRVNVSLEKVVLNRNSLGADNVALICQAITAGMVMLQEAVPAEIAAQERRVTGARATAAAARLARMRTWKGLQSLCLCNCDVAVSTVSFHGALAAAGSQTVLVPKGLDALGAMLAHPACTLKRLNLSKNRLHGS
jgi:hypothetical protein